MRATQTHKLKSLEDLGHTHVYTVSFYLCASYASQVSPFGISQLVCLKVKYMPSSHFSPSKDLGLCPSRVLQTLRCFPKSSRHSVNTFTMRTQNLRPYIFSPYVYFKRAELLDCRMINNELVMSALFALFVSCVSPFFIEKMRIIRENC